jgi:hypothetical protein
MSAFDDLERQLLISVGRRRTPQPAHRARELAASIAAAITTLLPRRSQRMATGAIAVAAIAAASLVLGTTGSGPTNAFAGWRSSPTAAASGQLQAAQAACQKLRPELTSLTPTVTDTRGAGSLLVYATHDGTTTCTTGPPQLGVVIGVSGPTSGTPVGAAAVEWGPVGQEFAADGQVFRQLAGQVGANVTAVTLVLRNGTTVQATVANGWFAAWWPASQPGQTGAPLQLALGEAAPVTFEITTANGTTITRPASPSGPTASTGATSTTGATGASATGASGASGSTPGIAPLTDNTLAASFAILRQPGPSPVQLPAGIAQLYRSPEHPNPYGIDPDLARYAPAANTWVLPGSTGVCLITYGIVGPGVGSGTCASDSTALAGDFVSFQHKYPDSDIALVGLAPDGNTTVTVTDANGTTRQIPVTDNIYVVTGGNPASITLLTASGATTKIGIS